MRVLIVSGKEVAMSGIEVDRAETVKAAKQKLSVSPFDVAVCDSDLAEELRAATNLPVVTIESASSPERVQEIVRQHIAFTEIQQGIEQARAHATTGRLALARVFARLSKSSGG